MSKGETPISPYGENYRICVYCGDHFIATHGLAQYCPYKFGVANYCKNKQKALMTEKRQADLARDLLRTSSVPPYDKNDMAILTNTIPSDSRLSRNIMFFDDYVEGRNVVYISWKILEWVDFDLRSFDEKVPIPNTDLFELRIGRYTIRWIEKEKFRITVNNKTK